LRLAKPLEAITLGEIVRHTETDMALVPCFAPIEASCAITPCCALRTALKRATTAFTDVLDAYTLKDLAKPRSALRALLAIAPAPRADAPRH
jgi:Rrf2 family nitric oxide-sensitive transcriptional repressor